MERYDVAIIGSGPAGISAAINLKIRKKNFIIFGQENLSEKLVSAPDINNYLGFPKIKGGELADNFKKHLKEMEIPINTIRVTSVYAMGDYFTICCNDVFYEATTIIVATGVNYGSLIDGEKELVGRGISYCATCDGPLYNGKEIAVVVESHEALEEVEYLKGVAKKTHVILKNKLGSDINADETSEIYRDRVLKISREEAKYKVNMRANSIDVDGVFVLRDSIEADVLIPGIETEDGHIKVNRKLETSIRGAFAAGDCVGKPYSYIKSAGEGHIAAMSVVSYLYENKKK